jgi:hypothetical protein
MLAPPLETRGRVIARRVVIAALVVACLAGLVVAALLSAGPGEEAVSSGSPIVRQVPGDGDTALRQSEVGVELTPGWEGQLVVNGVLIPDEQLQGRDPSATNELGEPAASQGNAPNLLFFQPGEGKVIEQFSTGRVCAAATYFRTADGLGTARTTSWCFEVD